MRCIVLGYRFFRRNCMRRVKKSLSYAQKASLREKLDHHFFPPLAIERVNLQELDLSQTDTKD